MFRCRAVGAAVLVATLFAADAFAQQCNRGGQGAMRGGMQGGGIGQPMMAGQMGGRMFSQMPSFVQGPSLNQIPSFNQMVSRQQAQLQQVQMQGAYNDAMNRLSNALRYQQHLAVRSQIAAENREDLARQREENRARIAAGKREVGEPLLVTNP